MVIVMILGKVDALATSVKLSIEIIRKKVALIRIEVRKIKNTIFLNCIFYLPYLFLIHMRLW